MGYMSLLHKDVLNRLSMYVFELGWKPSDAIVEIAKELKEENPDDDRINEAFVRNVWREASRVINEDLLTDYLEKFYTFRAEAQFDAHRRKKGS